MRKTSKRLGAVEIALQDLQKRNCRITLIDGESLCVPPCDAVFVYAPLIAAVHIGENPENLTQAILTTARLFGHPNPNGIRFFTNDGEITKYMHQAYMDRGLDRIKFF